MTWQIIVFMVISPIILLGLLVYWAIWLTEGVYFGRWAVRALYDLGASTYDNIKQYDAHDESVFLANPIFSRLEENAGKHAYLLDVATGTARLPLALFDIPFYEGQIVGLDQSRKMLTEAAKKTTAYHDRLTLLHHPSVPLPFKSESFDAVTCLEALEFMPDRHAALREMVRVLRPGGLFVVSNRIGLDARLMPGRTDPPNRFESLLTSLGLTEVLTRPWQEYYDLIFACKLGEIEIKDNTATNWLTSLRCPSCQKSDGHLASQDEWHCDSCQYRITNIITHPQNHPHRPL